MHEKFVATGIYNLGPLRHNSVKYSPMIRSDDDAWKCNELAQRAFNEFSTRIEARNHVEFDPSMPARKGWLDRDRIHLLDFDSCTFWQKIFDDQL